MQYRNLGYVVSITSCLLIALFLSGCAGRGGAGGFNINDARSAFQMVNEQTGNVRDFRNNLQQLMIKLNTLSTISEERLQNVNVTEVTRKLENISQLLTGGMGGIAVDAAVARISMRIPMETRMAWPYLAVPILTTAINIQASYLNVAVQYMNKNASTMTPDEVKRINGVLVSAMGTLNTLGV